MNRIEYNGIEVGRSDGGIARTIELGPNEIVENFQYHKAEWWWVDTLCSLTIKTNVNIYVVDGFEEWKAENPDGRYGYCGSRLFYAEIPRLEFSIDNSKYLQSISAKII